MRLFLLCLSLTCQCLPAFGQTAPDLFTFGHITESGNLKTYFSPDAAPTKIKIFSRKFVTTHSVVSSQKLRRSVKILKWADRTGKFFAVETTVPGNYDSFKLSDYATIPASKSSGPYILANPRQISYQGRAGLSVGVGMGTRVSSPELGMQFLYQSETPAADRTMETAVHFVMKQLLAKGYQLAPYPASSAAAFAHVPVLPVIKVASEDGGEPQELTAYPPELLIYSYSNQRSNAAVNVVDISLPSGGRRRESNSYRFKSNVGMFALRMLHQSLEIRTEDLIFYEYGISKGKKVYSKFREDYVPGSITESRQFLPSASLDRQFQVSLEDIIYASVDIPGPEGSAPGSLTQSSTGYLSGTWLLRSMEVNQPPAFFPPVLSGRNLSMTDNIQATIDIPGGEGEIPGSRAESTSTFGIGNQQWTVQLSLTQKMESLLKDGVDVYDAFEQVMRTYLESKGYVEQSTVE